MTVQNRSVAFAEVQIDHWNGTALMSYLQKSLFNTGSAKMQEGQMCMMAQLGAMLSLF
jgi:hypothetical protein